MESHSLELDILPGSLKLRWLGLTDYEEALTRQMETADQVRTGGEAILLACEHPTVITLGKRGQALSDILASMEALREEHIKIVATDRGGQATLHNPGQLVLYPIVPLRRWKLGVRNYVECLERATAHFLAAFGMEITRGYEPGLFVNGKKIASFGIRVDRGVCLHGVAINIFNKVDAFSLIRQCGMSVAATNLQREMEEFTAQIPPWDFPKLANQWKALFMEELGALTLNMTLDPVSQTSNPGVNPIPHVETSPLISGERVSYSYMELDNTLSEVPSPLPVANPEIINEEPQEL